MRKCECKLCEKEFYESDSNPAVHYSKPSDICLSCEKWERAKSGDYVQIKNGEYIKKP